MLRISLEGKLKHSIALKDVDFSNSMMEAFYRITKYGCLYLYEIKDFKTLIQIFTNWIEEYHKEKPHSG
jgi:putative transposase